MTLLGTGEDVRARWGPAWVERAVCCVRRWCLCVLVCPLLGCGELVLSGPVFVSFCFRVRWCVCVRSVRSGLVLLCPGPLAPLAVPGPPLFL